LKNCKFLSEQTCDSPAFLNAMWLLKHVLNCKQYSSFFTFLSRLSDIWTDCNRIIEGLEYYHIII
jgi:hypothetical protein